VIFGSPTIGAALLSPGVNLYLPTGVILWLSVEEDELDWEVVDAGDEAIGEPPPWLDMGEIMDHMRYSMVGGPVMDWALHKGLSPQQRFAVYCSKPHISRCSWEYEEYDVEYDIFEVKREPPSLSAREFECAISELFERKRLHKKRIRELKKAQWDNDQRMRLRWSFGGGYFESSVEPWCSVELISTLADPDLPEYHAPNILAWGRSDSNSREDAFLALKTMADSFRPDLDLTKIPQRYY